ncbi:mycofactocin oligosaccharide methyltransferase MftM [Amycolatopsis echigonensis]|uniref:Class I SAM-dependent methyltransferase n=1 Tax=Amycolatopsis echigonensis TaxID=2576905 RepID=A0A8E1VUF6_9PSEU|nr:mycofactocin oligosaccharide methyltransferase MftM [Amycolatopsis echigonensis]MBB2498521.1 class I SAM-dependent methyltransferase [Amycolatopsis echigonensis]
MTSTAPVAAPRYLDPLAPAPAGAYFARLLAVVREAAGADDSEPFVRTRHFSLHKAGRRVELRHRLRPDQLDNDLAGLLADELFTPGWLSGAEVFEHAFTGLVKSTVDDPMRAWLCFYDNTLGRIRHCLRGGAADLPARSVIAGFAPVYEHALRLTPPGRVLDLGSCFGFFALLLTERGGNEVVASDVSAGAMQLLDAVAAHRGHPLETFVCDAARMPLPDSSVDTVTLLHLLEHLDADAGEEVVREATRLARGPVVIAVPFEDEPAEAYGHVRVFDLPALRRLGARSGRRFTVHEHHGGWLVLHPR